MTERPESLNNQAIILAAKGDYPDAIACFKRAITIDRTNHLLWYNLGVTYRDAGELENASVALRKAHSFAPENEEILETLATTCYSAKEFEDSLRFCTKGLMMNPENSHFWNLMGVINFNNEFYQEAAECFEEAVQLNPYYKDALYNLKDTYSELNNRNGEESIQRILNELNGKTKK